MPEAPRRAGRPSWVLPAATILFVLASGCSAWAGSIGFRVDTEVDLREGVAARVTLTHTGDEAANDVVPTVELRDLKVSGRPLAKFEPKANHTWELRLGQEKLPPGTYATVVRVRYADANGYPFEIVSVARAATTTAGGPRIEGTFVVPKITVGGSIKGRLDLRKPERRTGPFHAVLVSPSGLKVAPARFPVRFDSQGKAKVPISITNRKLLAGTSVNIFALVSSDEAGVLQTDSVRGTIRVVAAPPLVTAQLFYRAAAATAFVLLVLELAGLRRRPVLT